MQARVGDADVSICVRLRGFVWATADKVNARHEATQGGMSSRADPSFLSCLAGHGTQKTRQASAPSRRNARRVERSASTVAAISSAPCIAEIVPAGPVLTSTP